MTDLIRAYFDPERYARELPIEAVVSDEKVDEGHKASLGGKGLDPATMRPIVVIKHPRRDLYAVLDGHHRFSVVRGMGCATIRAAVVDDYVGLGFHLTKRGLFQPTPAFTKHVRVPAKRFVAWMTEFLKHPEEMVEQAGEPGDGEAAQGE